MIASLKPRWRWLPALPDGVGVLDRAGRAAGIGVGEKGVALVGVDRKPVVAERNELP